MIRNYNENVFLESSGIALLFNLIFGVNTLDFILPTSLLLFVTSLVTEFVFHHRCSAILVM